ncbi:MAG: TolC family protein [Acidobacteria bacterium]|nr:TolC family protein [Acidobacteriota bacterium]
MGHLLTRSPSALESRAGTAVVEAQTRSWYLWPNPQAGYDHEGAGLTQYGTLQQTLPLSGRLGLLRQAGAAAVQVAEMQAEYNLWRLCSDMRQGFYELLFAQQREQVLQESIAAIQEVSRILRERERHGEGSLFDQLRAEREQVDLQAELASARATTAQARARLASFFDSNTDPVSIRARGEFGIAKELPPLSELLPLAVQNRQDYQAEKRLQERVQWEERAATRLRIPDPVFFAGIKRAEERGGIAYGPYLGFSVSIPVFDRGQNRVAELEAELKRSGYREEVLDQLIRSEVNGAYEVLQMRRQAEEEYRRQLGEQGPQLDRIAEVAYQEGEIGILELLDAYRVRRQTILRVLELTAARKQGELSLERVLGKPVLNPEVLP